MTSCETAIAALKRKGLDTIVFQFDNDISVSKALSPDSTADVLLVWGKNVAALDSPVGFQDVLFLQQIATAAQIASIGLALIFFVLLIKRLVKE